MPKELTPIEKALRRKKVAMGECITECILHLDLAEEKLLDSVMYSDKEQVFNVEEFCKQIDALKANLLLAFSTPLASFKEQQENIPYGNYVVSNR